MNELTETQKAYLAGFFDGEGCVSIGKYQGRNNRTPVYQLQIVVTQNADLAELCEMAGVGTIHINNKINKQTKRAWSSHAWRMSPLEGTALLKAILPYLRNKAPEARLAIEFQSKMSHKNSGGRGWVVPQEMIDEKERYYQAMRNIKGISGGNGGRGAQRKQK